MKIWRISKNVFILLSIVFIAACCVFYGSRLVRFYRIENPKLEENEELYKLITLKKNIVQIGDGLYKENDNYIYKGLVNNNYVKYSGRLWRIISTDGKNVKLISENVQTSLVWGTNTDYQNSLVKKWMNDNEINIKSFYESLNNTNFLVPTKTCVDVFDGNNLTCDNIIEENVGLLSAYEYKLAGAENSYLNVGEYWWTSNINSENKAWYVYSKGTLNNNVSSGKTYYAYGVRPTITVKGNTKVMGGDGTLTNPYNLDVVTSNLVNTKYVGEYVEYSNYIWRIIEKDNNYTKIVMDDVIKVDGEDYYTSYGNSNYMSTTNGVGHYLNTTFYDSLDNKEYILNYDYNLGRYDKIDGYDFNRFTDSKGKFNVGLLQIGELFTTSLDNYFLMTHTISTDSTIYQVLEEGRIYAGSISDQMRLRPTLYLKPDLTVISGLGTIEDPYKIG